MLDAMGGMSGVTVGLAIVAFSLGVELGHHMIILPLFFALRTARARRPDEAARSRLTLQVLRGGSAVISLAGFVYFIAALI